MTGWGARLEEIGTGTRVVVRYRIVSGFTDALGVLGEIDDTRCVVDTRTGPVTIMLAGIVAAKAVPPPPARDRRSEPGVGRHGDPGDPAVPNIDAP